MKVGVVVPFHSNIEEEFEKAYNMGFDNCQLVGWEIDKFTDEYAARVQAACKKYNITITAFWCGWSGPAVWNFIDGPLTLGIVPTEYRDNRMRELKAGIDFAAKIGVTDVITHMGFIPENPMTQEYRSLVVAVTNLANYALSRGRWILFETGQETPVTLKRMIEDVGTGNLGINLDPANLILYGKANPIDSLDVFGKYVRNVHGKDGLYPTDAMKLGKEVPIGGGKVNFEAFIQALKENGYDGAITIEREILGEQQKIDIERAKKYLEALISAVYC